ncbi:MAG: prohibitin family protein [Bacteroidota bacterium]|nr:prohibitin family protein [Bacteroidota bacterium]
MGVILIIIGMAILAIRFFLTKEFLYKNPNAKRSFIILGLVLFTLGVLVKSTVQIEPGEVGVIVLFGSVSSDQIDNGLHLINPLADVVHFNVKAQNYTMSGVHDEGEKTGDDAIRVLTADGLEVELDLTIIYQVIPSFAPRILQELGTDYNNKIVRPVSRTKVRDNAVYYDAISLYSRKRDEFQNRIFKDIEVDFKKRGIMLQQLLVRNITLPISVRQTIEGKINAEQESQKMQFVLQKERQEADRKRVEAQGIADYQKIISLNLTDKQLQYEQIKAQKEIATSPNSKVIIMGNSRTPLILNEGK